MFDRRGSCWSKWDLHVHTPASLIHQFPGSGDAAWQAYLDDLEALPSDFRVLGVNDYFFIEGYERLVAAKANGRLANIDLLLPVIELRLNVFGGTRGALSKVNAHVIFSPDVTPDVIRDQFIRALAGSFHLAPKYEGKHKWSGALTREALESLGQQIIESVPKGKRDQYGSPLMEGFANLTVSLDEVRRVLQRSYFWGRTVLGVGKTEWADVKWTGGSIADKKNIINAADVVFISVDSPRGYHDARDALESEGVNDRLLDCSDAHYPSVSDQKDRVGNSHTWIKASPTFGGLRQALQEFDERVFVGPEPPQLVRVREHPSRYIDRVELVRIPGASIPDKWFDANLPLNDGLVAVIGNRGSGKSALAEAIALAGNSSREPEFSFLHTSKFREPRQNLARHFKSSLHWANGDVTERVLSESPEPGATELVQHLPQQYLEKLCNEVPKGEKTEFDRELERIIFSHLPEEERMGASSLEERVELGSRSRTARLREARAALNKINIAIAELESRLRPENVRKVELAYRTARHEWYETKKAPPPRVPKPPGGTDPVRTQTMERIGDLAVAEAHLGGMAASARSRLAALRRDAASLDGFRTELGTLAADHARLLETNSQLLASAGLDSSVSEFLIDRPALNRAAAELASATAKVVDTLDPGEERSITAAEAHAAEEARTLRRQLAAPDERYQEYQERYRNWENELRTMLGATTEPDSVLGRRAQWQDVKRMPSRLKEAKAQRRELSAEIHGFLLEEANAYSDLYGPLERQMESSPVPSEYTLTVDTSLVDSGFTNGFLEERVNRHVAGSFCGKDVSLEAVTALLEATDFNNTESVLHLLDEIDLRLHYDYRTHRRDEVDPAMQVRKGQTVEGLYDFVWALGYLSPRFALRFGKRPIHLLSPGEKGVLLLIFFLLAETNTRPLVIDQPEDNLDNQTVFRALVRCFHTAKSRRQVVIVTHNPNLAVVCDADQVIVSAMEKESGNSVEYFAGPIEDPEISRAILDILEGTRPAFENRSAKYELHAPRR